MPSDRETEEDPVAAYFRERVTAMDRELHRLREERDRLRDELNARQAP